MKLAIKTLQEKKFYLEYRLNEDGWINFDDFAPKLKQKIKDLQDAIDILQLTIKLKTK
jgi:hypothetical protein